MQHIEALEYLLRLEDSMNWKVLTPAQSIAPGKKTEKYRTGKDELTS